jgi:hypothetical protein
MKEFNFEHPNFPHGGTYICYFNSNIELEIEVVTLRGVNWSYPKDITEFKEM